MQREGSIEFSVEIVAADHRGDGPYDNIHCLMLGGVQLGEKVMLHSLKYGQDCCHKDAKPGQTYPVGSAPCARPSLRFREGRACFSNSFVRFHDNRDMAP